MQVKIQVVTITDDGQETTRDIACVERQDLTDLPPFVGQTASYNPFKSLLL